MNKIPRSLLVTIAGATAVFSLAVQAPLCSAQGAGPNAGQPGHKKGPQAQFKSADTNADGRISQEEYRAFNKNRFQELDKNKDGAITEDELAKPRQGQQADVNKDGKITLDEYMANSPNPSKERFAAMDTNKDGVLTAADRPGKGAGQEIMGIPLKAPLRLEMWKTADTNRDGKVTANELTAQQPDFIAAAFTRLDTNKDGALSEEDKVAGRGNLLRQADKDNDGKVSFTEATAAFPKMTREKFDARDRNKDGFLTKEDHTK